MNNTVPLSERFTQIGLKELKEDQQTNNYYVVTHLMAMSGSFTFKDLENPKNDIHVLPGFYRVMGRTSDKNALRVNVCYKTNRIIEIPFQYIKDNDFGGVSTVFFRYATTMHVPSVTVLSHTNIVLKSETKETLGTAFVFDKTHYSNYPVKGESDVCEIEFSHPYMHKKHNIKFYYCFKSPEEKEIFCEAYRAGKLSGIPDGCQMLAWIGKLPSIESVDKVAIA